MRQPTVRRDACVEGGRAGKTDEDEEQLEACPAVEASSAEWESKKWVMGAWKRRRLVIDSMVSVGECTWLTAGKGEVGAEGARGGVGAGSFARISQSRKIDAQGEFSETVMGDGEF